MSREVIALYHTPSEELGTIRRALEKADLRTREIRAYQGEAVPSSMEDGAGLIVMGGPMGVYEQDIHPHLKDELRLIEDALTRERPILGICLGSQLLAAALGAPVSKGRGREIGWHELQLTSEAQADPLFSQAPQAFMGFHWHGDIFELPQGSVLLASSAMTENQIYRHGSFAWGLLCHLEVDPEGVAAMCEAFPEELEESGQSREEVVSAGERWLPRLEEIGSQVFSAWASRVAASPL